MTDHPRKLILVDFDRTLFDLDLFYEEVWRVLGEAHDFNSAAAYSRMRDFYYRPQVGYHGTYDFERHIHAYAPRLSQSAAMREVSEALSGKTFLYDDATEIFAWQPSYEVRILSYGDWTLQHFKLAFCQELKDIPTDIVMKPKAQFITAHFPHRHGYLIDDKIEADLPSGMAQIYIQRDRPIENISKSAMIVVNSLKQATTYL